MPRPVSEHTPSRRATFALPLLLLALAACSGIEVEAEQRVDDLARYRTYAWSPPPASDGGLVDAPLAASLRAQVDRQLTARGLLEVSITDADLLVRADVGVETRAVSKHAYNAGFFTLDRIEDGVIAIVLSDARSQDPVWEGRGTQRLRRSAKGYGLYEAKWVETDEPRAWKAAEVIDAIFERFPPARVAGD